MAMALEPTYFWVQKIHKNKKRKKRSKIKAARRFSDLRFGRKKKFELYMLTIRHQQKC